MQALSDDGMAWINMLVHGIWPEFRTFLEQEIFIGTLQPLIQANVPSVLKSIKFTKLSLGSKPFRLSDPRISSPGADTVNVSFQLDFNASDSNIELSAKRFPPVGLKELQFSARLGVCFSPLLAKSPLLGTVSVYFVDVPHVELDLTGLADILDLPFLSRTIRKIIKYQIAAFMVLPNRMVFQVADDTLVSPLRLLHIQTEPPIGVLRVHVKRAENLRNADAGFFRTGASDPYCSVQVDSTKRHTKVIKDNLNPVWDEHHNFVISSMEQSLLVHVKDEDTFRNDSLGHYRLEVREFLGHEQEELRCVLEDPQGGGSPTHRKFDWRGKFSHTKSNNNNPKLSSSAALAAAQFGGGDSDAPVAAVVLSGTWLEKSDVPSNDFHQDVVQVLVMSFERLIPSTGGENALLIQLVADDYEEIVWRSTTAIQGSGVSDKQGTVNVMQGANFLVDNTNPPPVHVRFLEIPANTDDESRAVLVGEIAMRDYTLGVKHMPVTTTSNGVFTASLNFSRWSLVESTMKSGLSNDFVKPVCFNQVSSGWINEYLRLLWPYLGPIVRDTLTGVVEPMINDVLPDSLRSLMDVRFQKIDLGSKAIRFERFDVFRGAKNEIDIQVDVVFEGETTDVELAVVMNPSKNSGTPPAIRDNKGEGTASSGSVAASGRSDGAAASGSSDSAATSESSDSTNTGWFAMFQSWYKALMPVASTAMTVGVQDIYFKGRIGIGLRPILTHGALIGAISVYMVNQPEISMDLTGAANVLDLPIIHQAVQRAINQAIGSTLVLPNRIVVPFIDETQLFTAMDKLSIRNPTSPGALKLRILGAKNIPKADLFNSASDPYCIVCIGDKTVRTETIDNTSNPDWSRESKDEFFVVSDMGQNLSLKVYDADTLSYDDLLGSFECTVQELVHILQRCESQLASAARYDELVADRVSSTPQGPNSSSSKLLLKLQVPDEYQDQFANAEPEGTPQVEIEMSWMVPTQPHSDPGTTGQLEPCGCIVEVLVANVKDLFLDSETRSQWPSDAIVNDQVLDIQSTRYLFLHISIKRTDGSITDATLSPPVLYNPETDSYASFDECFVFVLRDVTPGKEVEEVIVELIQSESGKFDANTLKVDGVMCSSQLRLSIEELHNQHDAVDTEYEFPGGETVELKIRSTHLAYDDTTRRPKNTHHVSFRNTVSSIPDMLPNLIDEDAAAEADKSPLRGSNKKWYNKLNPMRYMSCMRTPEVDKSIHMTATSDDSQAWNPAQQV